MTLRIISGERRGAHLRTPEGETTRPLRDRVRQALFNMLRPIISGRAVLDAFAGSGAVGLEALSNGATHALFIERDAAALQALADNIRKLRYEERALVVSGEVPAVMGTLASKLPPRDLVFLMPPYHSGLCERFLNDAEALRRLATNAHVVCEIHRDEPFEIPSGFAVTDDRLYGITRLMFLERGA